MDFKSARSIGFSDAKAVARIRVGRTAEQGEGNHSARHVCRLRGTLKFSLCRARCGLKARMELVAAGMR